MPDTVTLTAPTLGPAINPTSLIFNNVREVNLQFDRNVIEVVHGVPPRITHLEDAPIHGGLTYTVNADNTVSVAISWS